MTQTIINHGLNIALPQEIWDLLDKHLENVATINPEAAKMSRNAQLGHMLSSFIMHQLPKVKLVSKESIVEVLQKEADEKEQQSEADFNKTYPAA